MLGYASHLFLLKYIDLEQSNVVHFDYPFSTLLLNQNIYKYLIYLILFFLNYNKYFLTCVTIGSISNLFNTAYEKEFYAYPNSNGKLFILDELARRQ